MCIVCVCVCVCVRDKIMVWLLPEAEVEKKQEAVGDDDLFGGDDDFDLDMLEHDIDTANLPVRKDKRVYLRQAHRNAVSAMSVQPVESAFGKDGFLLVSSSPEHCVKVWHVQLRPVGEMDDVYAGKVQQQGDLCRMKMRHEFSGHPSAVSKLILLSDQCTSLSSSFDSIYLHHISRGKSGAVDDISVQVSFRYDGNIQDMDLTQDEKLLFVVGSDYVVYGYRIGLPTDWLEAKDKQGRVFYRHKDHDPQDDKRKAWFSWTHPYLLNSDPFRSCEEAMRTGVFCALGVVHMYRVFCPNVCCVVCFCCLLATRTSVVLLSNCTVCTTCVPARCRPFQEVGGNGVFRHSDTHRSHCAPHIRGRFRVEFPDRCKRWT